MDTILPNVIVPNITIVLGIIR